MNKPFFELKCGRTKPRTAVFMSGSGSNAEVLLNLAANGQLPGCDLAAVVTDNPEKSRSRELAEKFNLPLVDLSIKEFYHSRNEKVSVATPAGRELRRQWTDELLAKLEKFDLDFGIFAGFVPLCSINEAFPCLNVHPGDLTVEDADGVRRLTGLHTIPIERAILGGFTQLRSSVIVVQSLEAAGNNIDAGPILGVSEPLNIDFRGFPLEELRVIAAHRPAKRPVGGWKDELEALAAFNQERLKYAGDHLVLPKTVAMFAANRYSLDAEGNLYWDGQKIKTIEFFADGQMKLL